MPAELQTAPRLSDFRLTLRLALPLIMAEVGWMSMGVVDTIMVGRMPDSAIAIGATGLGQSLYHVIVFLGAGLLLGMDTFVAQAYGREDLHDARKTLLNGIVLALLLTPILMIAVSFWPALMRHFGISVGLVGPMQPFLLGAELGHAAIARIFRTAALSAGGKCRSSDHVCAGLRKHCECGRRLGADLWAPRISRRGHYRLRMVHLLCAHLHDAGAGDHVGVGGIESVRQRSSRTQHPR